MRICVLAPSPQYRNSAGARIRYRRIEPFLVAMGHSMSIIPIEEVRASSTLDADIYLITKCYDSRGLTVARILKDHGKVVGIDLFDDLFSQVGDARLIHHREWLRGMGAFADFALCSTPRMQEIISATWPGRPAHVVNDPFGEFDISQVANLVDRKVKTLRDSRKLLVAWFGQGDNTHFPVGLRDLTAFSCALRALGATFDVKLRILTNQRALTCVGLERLHGLPVPFEIEEWSESGERALLAESPVAFIPVNGQPFSAAKSLNRCVSALTQGCQILTAGYPLYRAFDDFIYTDPEKLAADIDNDSLKLNRATTPVLGQKLTDLGNPAIEAAKLATFLAGLQVKCQPVADEVWSETLKLGVVHGRESTNDAHRSIQKLGHLSIASPFSRTGPTYDVVFDVSEDGRLGADISYEAMRFLGEGFAARGALTPGSGAPRFSLDLADVAEQSLTNLLIDREGASSVMTIARYGPVMDAVVHLCGLLFPGIELFVSENDPNLVRPQRDDAAARLEPAA